MEETMSIPSQSEMNKIVLEFMQEGGFRRRKAIKSQLIATLNLSEEDKQERTKSGVLVSEARVGWGISYLARAGFLAIRSAEGYNEYDINQAGRDFLSKDYDIHEFNKLVNDTIKENNPWKTGTKKEKKISKENNIDNISPEEQIDNIVDELNSSLYSELIQRILDNEPYYFEKLIVKLLEKMGYGVGEVTQRTNDGGIDGLITTDELGFNPIITQAKRYDLNHPVGRPDIQNFAGALNGRPNGVFITTSYFASTAIEYAKNCSTSNIVLIDGERLAELMVKYNLGVSTDRVIELKKIDSDFFEDE